MTDLSTTHFDAEQRALLEQLADIWERRARVARGRWAAAPPHEQRAHAVEAELYRHCAGELGRAARRGVLPAGPVSPSVGR